MSTTAIQIGFDIATSLSIIGAAGVFLWESLNNKKERRKEYLLRSLDSLKQNCVKFIHETNDVHNELDVFLAKIKNGEIENDPEIVGNFKRRVVYSAWDFKNEIEVLKVSDFSIALNKHDITTIDALILELDAVIEWYTMFFEGKEDAPKLIEGKYKSVWRALDEVPLKIIRNIVDIIKK